MAKKKSLGLVELAAEMLKGLVKFRPRAKMKVYAPISDEQQASAVLKELGMREVLLIRDEADLAEDVLARQEAREKRLAPILERVELDMTRLRDWAIAQELDLGGDEPKTKHLGTGDIAFHDGPPRLKVSHEDELIAALLALPAKNPLRALLVFPPPPPPQLDRDKLLADPKLIDQVNQVVPDSKVERVKAVFFSVFPTALDQLRKGLKITGKVKDVPVKL